MRLKDRCASQGPLAGSLNHIADWVHGADGLGNTNQPPPSGRPDPRPAAEVRIPADIAIDPLLVHWPVQSRAVDTLARQTPLPALAPLAQFIVDMADEQPGEISLLCLASLTNLALALQRDPSLDGKLKEVIVLGKAHAGLADLLRLEPEPSPLFRKQEARTLSTGTCHRRCVPLLICPPSCPAISACSRAPPFVFRLRSRRMWWATLTPPTLSSSTAPSCGSWAWMSPSSVG